ncbi:TPA: hypothetical protein EYP75_03790 [Candidatus Bathyarchaeota archaeon]|nr:hypothetical protein [Candidatus Bathyarchaeota archaeon]
MSMNLDASKLIGKTVKIRGEGEIGVIVSFIMDPSGQVKDVLIERKQGILEKYSAEMLQIEGDDVFISSLIEKKLKILSENLPTAKKKRQVLEKLSKEKIVPQAIFESLIKKFDKMLKEMKDEAKSLMDEIEKEAKLQEDYIKTIQMARAFLEIEHAMGTVSKEIYKRSIVALLRDMKNAQQKRLELLRTKEKIDDLLEEKPEVTLEEKQEAESPAVEEKIQEKEEEKEERKAIPVRITQE